MSTKSLLINYAGYPASLRMLVPDNGVANLAGALLSKGHTTTILDYATVNTIGRLFPYAYRDRLKRVSQRIMGDLARGIPPSMEDKDEFHALHGEVEAFQKKRVGEIAIEICDLVKKDRIDFVGMKLWVGDGFEGSMTIARELRKRCPDVPVFAGGPHVDWFGEKILEYCDMFDILACGEGEEVIVMLAEYVRGRRKLEEIPNLIYRKNGVISATPKKTIEDLGCLPQPVYDEGVYPAMKGDQKLKLFLTDDSRGCPNSCSFCLHPEKSGRRWRTKAPGAVVDEMERISRLYGGRVFRFAGSNTPQSLARGVAEEIIKRRVHVEYVAFASSRGTCSVDEFRQLKESGCFGLWFGVESGNQELLDTVMNKRVTAGSIAEKIKACRSAGIFACGSVVMPAPFETERSREDTMRFLLDVRPDSVIVDPPVIIPGTRWEEECDRYGIKIPDRDAFIRASMFYKMKMLYPPALLKPFPYFTINGKTDAQVFLEASDFSRRLEMNGILTQVTVDTALIAKYAGVPSVAFRDRNSEYFMTGNHDAIEKEIIAINAAVMVDTGGRKAAPNPSFQGIISALR